MQRVRTHFEAAIEAERGAGTMEREQREREREQRERERERSSLDLAAAREQLAALRTEVELREAQVAGLKQELLQVDKDALYTHTHTHTHTRRKRGGHTAIYICIYTGDALLYYLHASYIHTYIHTGGGGGRVTRLYLHMYIYR
jgi:hypothetical protein